MRKLCLSLGLSLTLLAPAGADVYIYNTTDERMTWQVKLPNGDTKDGTVKEYTGYSPAQTTIPTKDGVLTTFKITSESGQSAVEVKAPYSRNFLLYKKDGALKFEPVSWSQENGQARSRELTLFNATGEAQTFDLIDEKEMRPLTIAPGEMKTVPARNGFGSSGFHQLKFANGHRLDNQIGAGYFVILYNDKRDPGKVQAGSFGFLAAPKGVVTK